MILVTLGCSFVQGVAHPDTPPHNLNLYYKNIEYKIDNFKYKTESYYRAWPNLLNNEFEQVINLGKQGKGNNYIQRVLLNFLTSVKQTTIDKCIFIISWSMSSRLEFYLHNGWQFLCTNGEILIGRGFNQDEIESIKKYTCYLNSKNQELLNTYLIRLATETILKKYNVNKYLETALTWESLTLPKNCDDSYLINMYNIINKDNQILDTSKALDGSGYTQEELHYSCGHPNELGNQLLADYYIKSIKDRGWV